MSIKNTLPGQGKFNQGYFTPKNPEKYKGILPIRFLSSWEHKMMIMLDSHPFFLSWSSESIKIPYYNPITKKDLEQEWVRYEVMTEEEKEIYKTSKKMNI